MELLFIIAVIVVCLCWVLRKPEIPDIAKSPVIEDSSHLKTQYESLKSQHFLTLQELGQYKHSLKLQEDRALEITRELVEVNRKFEKLQFQKKSSEVKTGTFVEILAPISDQFPVNPKTMRFLGSPIDYISFDYETDTITFVEVKSGESQLNDNQKKVKSMVERGRVEFKTVRLNGDGIKVK